jgi:NAD(P)-dependent dehydrogenase (short-subunit alcohol dehydrogenase family)
MSRTTHERPLAGKVALVTGGSRGIGVAITIQAGGEIVGLRGVPAVQNDVDRTRAAISLVPNAVPAKQIVAQVAASLDLKHEELAATAMR